MYIKNLIKISFMCIIELLCILSAIISINIYFLQQKYILLSMILIMGIIITHDLFKNFGEMEKILEDIWKEKNDI